MIDGCVRVALAKVEKAVVEVLRSALRNAGADAGGVVTVVFAVVAVKVWDVAAADPGTWAVRATLTVVGASDEDVRSRGKLCMRRER